MDFVARLVDGSVRLLQVCESIVDPKTRKRELSALGDAMDELDLKAATIVTLNQEETIAVDSGKIEAVPAWRFLLESIE